MFVRAADMDGNGRIMFDSADRISDVALARIRKGKGAPGDVIFSHKGTVGKLAIAPSDAPTFVCSPQTTFWRTLSVEKLDRGFLYAFMRSPLFWEQWYVRKGETDMADYVSLTAQRGFQIPLPRIDEQRAIAGVLGALDEKIEANRRLNETLEATCQTLFRSWFVDCDPVHAKAEHRTPVHLAADFADLFPSTFTHSEKGPIPKGWEWMPLDEVATFTNGLALQKYRPQPGEPRLPVIKIAQLRAGRPADKEWSSASIKKACVLQDGDLVFSWSGSLLVTIWCGGPGALNQHLFKVTSERFPKWFCHQWTLAHLPEFRAIAADKATTMGHIRRYHLTEALCAVPTQPVLQAASALMEPALELYVRRNLESRTLASLRDLLLPKLLSGEICLPEAEKLVCEAL